MATGYLAGLCHAHDGKYGELEVLKSAAGWYIGTVFYNDAGYTEPGSRESGYYDTKEAAQLDLDEDCWDQRLTP
jgi:hypothetical protein